MLCDLMLAANEVVGARRRIGDSVAIMSYGDDAAIMFVPMLLEDCDDPRTLFGDRERWGSKVSNRLLGYFREDLVCHTQVQVKGSWGMLMEHTMPIGV